MPKGRPSKKHVAPDGNDRVWNELLVLGEDDRLRISADLQRRCPWLASGTEVLAVLTADAVVELRPPGDLSSKVSVALARPSDSSDEKDALILAAQRRYVRLRVNVDSRIVMPKDVRLCLGLHPTNPVYVNIVLIQEAVTLIAANREQYQHAEDVVSRYDLP